MQNIALLGSTGSIGTQTLDVISQHPDRLAVCALAAYSNDDLLEKQINKFCPDIAVLVDKCAADRLVKRYNGPTKILTGESGLLEAATYYKTDTVLTAMVGFAGLKPTIAAIEAGKTIALANKETLVAAGAIVMPLAKEKNVAILPVDSEHSAIAQCLNGEKKNNLEKILLTASGGPFRGCSKNQLENVTLADCLKHPNWSMGKKITIDSATLVNKGLEVIEAHWLFNIDYDCIQVLVHPQSIIHSMVEFVDGSVIAQLGMPDMRLPIQYALSYPERYCAEFKRLDFKTISGLTFEEPDTTTFRALSLAFTAGKTGGTMPCVFNAANEAAVYAFMQHKIGFLAITDIIEEAMSVHSPIVTPTLDDIYAADEWAREFVLNNIKGR